MTREDRITCPACGKRIARLETHFRQSHPDLDPADFGIDAAKLPPGPEIPASAAEAVPPEDELDPDEDDLPEPPDRTPQINVDQVLQPFFQLINEQRQLINELRGEVQRQGQDLQGFQRQVVEELNKVPATAQMAVTSTLDQLMSEAQGKAAQEQGQAVGAPAGGPAAAMAADPKMAMLTQLLPILAQKLLAPEKPATNSLLDQIQQYQALSAIFTAPMMQGVELATKFMAAGSRAGLRPEDIAIGTQAVADTFKQQK